MPWLGSDLQFEEIKQCIKTFPPAICFGCRYSKLFGKMVNSIKYDEIIGYKEGSNERNISFGSGNVQDAYNT